MKAVAVSEYGATPTMIEVGVPTVGADGVLIRIIAAGINPMDSVIAHGDWADRFDARFPLVLGADVAGVVEAVGEKVGNFETGEAVFGQLVVNPLGSTGTYAEYVVAPSSASLAPIPAGLSTTVAASLPTAAGTALGIVDQLGDITGQSVLIIGAGGGVGSFLTQFAATAGARVTTVAATSEAARLLGYGATTNLDRNAGPIAESVRAVYPDGIDILLDLAESGADFDALARAVVRSGGTALSTRFAARIEELAVAGITGINFSSNITGELLTRLAGTLVDGTITVPPITTVALDDVPALLAAPHAAARGKTVIAVRPAQG